MAGPRQPKKSALQEAWESFRQPPRPRKRRAELAADADLQEAADRYATLGREIYARSLSPAEREAAIEERRNLMDRYGDLLRDVAPGPTAASKSYITVKKPKARGGSLMLLLLTPSGEVRQTWVKSQAELFDKSGIVRREVLKALLSDLVAQIGFDVKRRQELTEIAQGLERGDLPTRRAARQLRLYIDRLQ